MAVQHLHHYSISAPAHILDAMVEFYGKLLDLHPGERPDFGFGGYWLYAGAQPLLHLLEDENRQSQPKGYLDHIALRCDGLEETVARLDANSIHYDKFGVPGVPQIQVVVTDPAGTTVELNFISD